MKHKEFNKFGGTEYRLKDQISAYVLVINWILKYQKNNSFSKIDAVEEAFRKYCKDENIYEYEKSDTKFGRFDMVLSNLEKDLHILQLDNNTKKYKLNDNFDIKDPLNSFCFFMQKAWPELNFPFKQALKFMQKNKNLNDAKKISRAFMVYDGNESFEYLYNIDVIDKIVEDEFKKISLTNDLKKIIKFRKPIKNLTLIKNIYQKRYKGLEILDSDLNNFKKNDKYWNQIVFDDAQHTRVINPKIYIKKLNEINAITFLKRLRKAQLKQIIDHEYHDLFNRWMYGIGLATSSSTTEAKYLSDRIDFKNNNYLVNIPNNQLCYPFTLEECIENLKKIQKEKYLDIKKASSLDDIPNSAIAEYFVNLFFCYKLKIKPTEFKKYVNTQIDDKLKPIFTAPGRVPDMWFKKDSHVYCVETTMIKNSRQILMMEPIPCTGHLYETLNEHKLNFENNHLYFINCKNNKEFSEKLSKAFEMGWEFAFKKGEKFCKLNFISYSFDDLVKMNNI